MELAWNNSGSVVELNWRGTGVLQERRGMELAEVVWNWRGTGVELVWNWCGTGVEP